MNATTEIDLVGTVIDLDQHLERVTGAGLPLTPNSARAQCAKSCVAS
jgi:hypothetical protein